MIRHAARAQRKLPVRFVSKHCRHASTLTSSMELAGTPTPALLNSTSRCPNFATISLKATSTETSSVTSQGRTRALACPLETSTKGPSRRPIRPTFQPASKKNFVVDAPIPDPAPVTIIVFAIQLPSKRLSPRVSLLHQAIQT